MNFQESNIVLVNNVKCFWGVIVIQTCPIFHLSSTILDKHYLVNLNLCFKLEFLYFSPYAKFLHILTAFKQIWNKTDKADLFIPNVLMI